MKYVRISHGDRLNWAVLVEDRVRLLSAAPYSGGELTGEELSLSECELLAPCEPGKIIAIGKNYLDHIRELKNDTAIPDKPILFLKPPSSIIGPGESIILPPSEISNRIDFEAELAFVIGKRAKNISAAEASQFILGYTCLNDVTARDVQLEDKQWTRAKGFDTFAPVGPWLTDEPDPRDVLVTSMVNGEIRQSERTTSQIWDVFELTAFISKMMTLNPGDLITTGTPAGIGQLHAGDTVTVSVEGIGELINHVV